MKAHLRQGFGYGNDFSKISSYVKDLLRNIPSDSDVNIIVNARQILDGYFTVYETRQRELQSTKGYRTFYQGRVHEFIEDLFGVEFFSEKQVKMAVDAENVIVINDEGNHETIKIHGQFKFDGYLELTKSLKEYLGLDDKWIGIAFEAMGTYWHSLPAQKEADRKKRLICKDKNIILLEIWEEWNQNTWMNKILEQIKEQTGIEFTKEQFSKLRNYLGTSKSA